MHENDKHSQKVAMTILEQLGGQRFSMMTGMKLRMAHEATKGTSGALSFHLPSRACKDGINYVKITLTTGDLYNMEFVKIGPRPNWKAEIAGKTQKITTVKTFEGVTCDQIEDLFSTTTGLATRL